MRSPSSLGGTSKKRRPTIALEWRNVSFSVDVSETSCCSRGDKQGDAEPKQILKELAGQVVPGQLLALMGPSGAGKTTLLNVLSGGNSKHTGEVLLNGKEWNDTLKRCSAYVQQDDLFPPQLTVLEHLTTMSRLRMDHGLTEEQRRSTVEDAMEMLGLTKCKDTTIGEPGVTRGVSGGERKRLSIASEILNDPSLIFLDEPTSGLDSFMAEAVVQQLRDLASEPNRPRTIIATIHQPSSQTFALFDYLNLIADGRNAYFGPASDATSYFEGTFQYTCPAFVNPSDFFLSLLSPQVNAEVVQRVCDHYQPCGDGKGAAVPSFGTLGQTNDDEAEVVFKSRYPARWYTQLLELVKRALTIKARNPRELQVQIFQIFFFSMVIGALYFQLGNNQKTVQNVNGLHFMAMMMMAMSQIAPTIQVFAGDMPMFMREHKNGLYSVSALFAARNLSDIPMQLLLPAGYGTIVFFMAGLPFSAKTFFIFLFILMLHGSCGASLGYCIGCGAPTRDTAQNLMPLAILPQMFLAGFMINLDSIPAFIAWAKHISFFRYTYQALMLNIWDDWGSIACDGASRCAFKTGKEVVTYLSLDASDATDLPQSIFALIALAIGFRVIAWLILCRRAANFITADA